MLGQGNIKTFNDTKKDITDELYTQGEIYPVGFPDASVITFLTLPMWTQPWNIPGRVKEVLKGGRLNRFGVSKDVFRESGKARNIMRLQMLSPDSVQETAVEEGETFDFPQLPTQFPELAGLGQYAPRYIPEQMPVIIPGRRKFPILKRRILPVLPPGGGGRTIQSRLSGFGQPYRYIPERSPVPIPRRMRLPIYRRRRIPGRTIFSGEMAGFDQIPEGTPHIIYQGITDPLSAKQAERDSSGFLTNLITKTADWYLTLQKTKYEAETANAQTQLAEAQSKISAASTQAGIMSILPWGILVVAAAYMLKPKGKR